MKQQRKKQKIQGKKGLKVEQNQTKVEPEEERKVLNTKKSGPENLPTIQNMLEIPKEQRDQRTKQYFQTVKPFIRSYVVKKEGSRVLQLMYKWGNEEIRAFIFETIIKNWKQLLKSKYAIYMISKVAVDHQIPFLATDAVILQNNREGAVVLQNFIAKHPNSKVSADIFHRFESIAAKVTEDQIESQQTLHNLAVKSIQKNYFNLRVSKLILRLTLSNLFEAEREKAIESLIENYSYILDEEEGIKLFIQLINVCDQKRKRGLVKSFKGQIQSILNSSSVSYIAILKFFTQTDDTVMIGKKLIPEMLKLLPEIEENKKLYNVLISLMSQRTNNFNCLGKYEPQVYNTTCKKPEHVRLRQIREYLYDDIVQFLLSEESIHQTCVNSNRSKLALGTLKSMQKEQFSTGLEKLSAGIFDYAIQDLNKNLNSKGGVLESIMADSFGSKLIKNIIIMSCKSQAKFVAQHCDKLTAIFLKDLPKILKSKATFVLSGLVDSLQTEKSVNILKQIQKSKPNFKQIPLGNYYQDKIAGINK